MTISSKRAARLREKVKRGGTLTASQQAEMDSYVPKSPGRRPAGATLEVDAPPGAPQDAPASLAGDDEGGAPPVAPEFSGPGYTAPAPDAPRVKPRTEKGKTGKANDWRSKYRAGAADGEREATCLQLAELWVAGLVKCNAVIRKYGGTPAVPDSLLVEARPDGTALLGPIGKCIVLTVDKLIPSDFSMGPEVEAAAMSSLVTLQALWYARKARTVDAGARPTARQAAYVNPDIARDPAPEPDVAPPPARALSVVKAMGRPTAPPVVDDRVVF